MKYLKLFETYKSQKELEKLTDLCIRKIAHETWDWHDSFIWNETKGWENEPWSTEGKTFRVKFLIKPPGFVDNANYVVSLNNGHKIMFKGYNLEIDYKDVELTWSEVNQFIFKKLIVTNVYSSAKNDINEFDETRDFIENTDIQIKSTSINPNGDKGALIAYSDKNMEIRLYHNDNYMNELSKNKREKTLERNVNYQEWDLYSTLYFKFNKTILHELQHAYDMYRSKGKAFKKQDKTYQDRKKRANFIQKKKEELKEEEVLLLSQMNREYLNLPHEIDARFTQVIKEINFAEIDFTETGYYYKMVPFDKVLKSFKIYIRGWDFMNAKDRKRLLRRLSQFWHLEKEILEEKNKKILKENILIK